MKTMVRGSLLLELAGALLLIASMAYGIAHYRWQTVVQQKEALLRLQALQLLANFLEQSLVARPPAHGQRQVGGVLLSWHAHDWQPLFDHALQGLPAACALTVQAEYEVAFSPHDAKKRKVVVCTVLPQGSR